MLLLLHRQNVTDKFKVQKRIECNTFLLIVNQEKFRKPSSYVGREERSCQLWFLSKEKTHSTVKKINRIKKWSIMELVIEGTTKKPFGLVACWGRTCWRQKLSPCEESEASASAFYSKQGWKHLKKWEDRTINDQRRHSIYNVRDKHGSFIRKP